ncbi:MAG: hypothetical protein J5858_14720, partial [Lentisphaeria bacterium]|nr:hypothetical protein [Lentisphaeria bacterium]
MNRTIESSIDVFADASGFADELGRSFAESMEGMQPSIWEKFLLWLYEHVFDAVGNLFTSIGTLGADLFNMAWVQAFLRLFRYVGWTLFLAGLVVAVFDTAVEYQSMRRIDAKHQMLPMLYGFLAVQLFTVVPVKLYVFCGQLQGTFVHELANLFGAEVAAGSVGEAAGSALGSLQMTGSLTNLFFLLALAWCVLKVLFANIARGGILLCQIAVGSLHLFSLPKGDSEGFVLWMKQVIGLCLTAFLQITVLYLGLLTWQVSVLSGLGLLIAATEVPRVAQQFGMETGMRASMRSM